MVGTRPTPSPAMLKEIKLLQAFDEAHLKRIIEIGKTLHVEPHSNVIIEGDLSWGLYLILDGVVGIYKNNRLTGDHYDVGQLRTGNFFGEMSLIDNGPRSATVRALTHCHLFYLSKESFDQFLKGSQDLHMRFYQSCIKTLALRLRELDESYVVSQYQLWKTALKKESA